MLLDFLRPKNEYEKLVEDATKRAMKSTSVRHALPARNYFMIVFTCMRKDNEHAIVEDRLLDNTASLMTGTGGAECVSLVPFPHFVAAYDSILEIRNRYIEVLKKNLSSRGDEYRTICGIWNATLKYVGKGDYQRYIYSGTHFNDLLFAATTLPGTGNWMNSICAEKLEHSGTTFEIQGLRYHSF